MKICIPSKATAPRETLDPSEVTTLVLRPASSTPARRWTRRQWIPAALAGVGGVLFAGREGVLHVQERRQQAAFAGLQEQIRLELIESDRLATQAIRPLKDALQHRLRGCAEAGGAAAPQCGQALGNFWDCFHLIVRMGMDQVKGTNLAASYIAERLGGVLRASAQMQSALQGAQDDLRHALLAQNHQLAVRWMQAAKLLPLGLPGGPALAGVGRLEQQTRGQMARAAVAAGLAGGGVLAAGIHIYLQRGLITRVLGKFARRAAQALGANLALAVADGPLPFGEILALLMDVGFSLWSALDVWHLSRALPGQIADSLCEGLRQCEQEALDHFNQTAAQLLSAASDARQQAAAPILSLQPTQITALAQ